MVLIDPTSLLVEVSPDAPSGPDLEYDNAFLALERTARIAPQERAVGPDAVVEEPNWALIVKQAAELLARSKDLRITSLLTKSLLRASGLAGLRDGVTLLRGLVERYWDTIHPQLDPEFDNDPTSRINAMRELNDRRQVLNVLRSLPLVEVPRFGKLSLREIPLGGGDAQPAGAVVEGQLDAAKVDAIFTHCPLEQLSAVVADVSSVRQDLRAIENWVTDKVGAQEALSFEELQGVLDQIERVLKPRLAARSKESAVTGADTNGNTANTNGATGVGAEGQGLGVTQVIRSAVAVSAPGTIASRADVQRMLDSLCAYYAENEPSSPVPLLLRRARRLTTMSFLDIVRDLAPGGADEVEKIRGRDGDESPAENT
ncbi:MAG: type secretion system protein TssA [Pseudomonadota bacterium]|jgi:type VI secretion system protein ImpA